MGPARAVGMKMNEDEPDPMMCNSGDRSRRQHWRARGRGCETNITPSISLPRLKVGRTQFDTLSVLELLMTRLEGYHKFSRA